MYTVCTLNIEHCHWQRRHAGGVRSIVKETQPNEKCYIWYTFCVPLREWHSNYCENPCHCLLRLLCLLDYLLTCSVGRCAGRCLAIAKLANQFDSFVRLLAYIKLICRCFSFDSVRMCVICTFQFGYKFVIDYIICGYFYTFIRSCYCRPLYTCACSFKQYQYYGCFSYVRFGSSVCVYLAGL